MVALRKRSTMTLEEFLTWEERQDRRHEFIGGVIHPLDETAGEPTGMVGGTLDHNQIAANIDRTLAQRLRGTPCRVFRESVKVPVDDDLFYPDVFVTCQKLAGRDRMVAEPSVIVEVLSDSTERRDHTVKSDAYKRIPSLKQYILVDQHTLRVESLLRTEIGWVQQVALGLDGVLAIPSLSLDLPPAEIYEDTDLLAEARAAEA